MAAVVLYPGGTVFARQGPGSFWLNFLCDVTADVAVNGLPNPRGSACAKAAMVAFGCGLACFWSLLPRVLSRQGVAARAAQFLGLASLFGLALAPFTEGRSHVVAVMGSSIPAMLAGGWGVVATWKHAQSRLAIATSSATVLAALVDAVLYVDSYLHTPRVVVPALPVLQKVALLGTITWMALVARTGLRRSNGEGPA
jgi:hypothetical protein